LKQLKQNTYTGPGGVVYEVMGREIEYSRGMGWLFKKIPTAHLCGTTKTV
jgi:hypothetical protein